MASTNKKEVYAALKALYPDLKMLEIAYEGSGDNFGDFYSIDGYDKDGNLMDILSGDVQSIVEDYCFHIFDLSGQPDFNNEGSEGYIKLDLLNYITTLDNYEVIRDTRHTGTEEF